MTRKDAAVYLRPVAESATLSNYKEALTLAVDALEDVERLEEIVARLILQNNTLVNKVLEMDSRLAGEGTYAKHG